MRYIDKKGYMRYTLQDYSDILFSGVTYKLPENISSIIAGLTKELGVVESDTVERTNRIDVKRTRMSDHRFKSKADDGWKAQVPFKATKIEKKEGVEKQINDIRVCLNKISSKNYEQQRDSIFGFIESIDDDSSYLEQIAKSIFDIASSNKFYSELYAGLYQDLIEKFAVFSRFTVHLIEEYYQSMDSIKDVDSNENYNLYCENNKNNDKRKAISMFIVNLMKKGVIDQGDVLQLVLRLQEKVMSLVDIEGHTFQVDEMTENLFIMVPMVHGFHSSLGLNQRGIKMGHSPRFAKESLRLSYGESGERYELGLDGMRSIPKPKRSDSTRSPQSPINSSGSLTDKQIKLDIYVPFEMFNGLEGSNDLLTAIRNNVDICSKYKTKEHKSISSRAIFKYMDMKDKISCN